MTREDANQKNLCTSCTSTNCIFAYGVIRKQCEFYETDKEGEQSGGDLISRARAIEALGEKPLVWTEGGYELGLQNQWQSDVDAIKAVPSVQTEIIRCKDCGYYDPADNDEESDWCHVWGETTEENAFCSYAKRKGEKDE